MIIRKLIVPLSSLLLLMTGCAAPQMGPPQAYVAPYHLQQQPAKALDGRIYQRGREFSLFQDVKARQIGDILTVVLSESTSGQKQADTSIDKSTSNNMSVPNVGGETWGNWGAELESESEFSGEGASRQSNKLDGSISVVVTDILPGGNLVVQGEKWIAINQGDEYVRLSGIVRPEDVSTQNTVPSTKIADARISYGANGAVAEANSVGWLSRFFMSPIWPF
ncbi:MAG: flagellar basal body L-ring protein FlgH [Halieaceae bacterium]